jgi:hypothetical protein
MAELAVIYDPNEHDRHHRYQPTVVQTAVALAMLGAAHDACAVLVPIAAPGKKLGVWTVGQTVEHPPGYFLVMTNDGIGPYSFAVARDEAEAAAERHMVAVPGVAGWATIHRDGRWTVSEGKELN